MKINNYNPKIPKNPGAHPWESNITTIWYMDTTLGLIMIRKAKLLHDTTQYCKLLKDVNLLDAILILRVAQKWQGCINWIMMLS